MSLLESLPFDLDLNIIPTTLDAYHAVGAAIIGVLSLFLLLSLIFRPKKAVTPEAVEAPKPVEQLKSSNPDSALQLLGLLQQEGRLIDFLQEDLTGFSDADVGATARVIHEGGRKVLNEYFTLVPIREESEEQMITLQSGFNAAHVRLTGNVTGSAPFTGVLLHKGWQITNSNLPKLAPGHDVSVVAPAEIEL